jgi:hypothetical protein
VFRLYYIPLLYFCTIVNTAWHVLTLWFADRLTVAEVVANILNKQLRKPTMGGPPDCMLGEVLINPYRKNLRCCETFQKAEGV